MKRVFAISAIILSAIACSKDNNSDNTIPKSVTGKWAFMNSTGFMITEDAIASHQFADTLIFDTDLSYFIIKNHDTTDRGTYTIGHGQSINGFGNMQQYDSILFKTDLPPIPGPRRITYPYYRIVNDTLSVSTQYFKDSSADKAFVSYVRNK